MTSQKRNANKAGKRTTRGQSDATFAQYRRIIEALRRRPHSTEELRMLGIWQAASRIKELKDRHGFDIDSSGRISIVDAFGFPHDGIAVYVLLDEPEVAPKWMQNGHPHWLRNAIRRKRKQGDK